MAKRALEINLHKYKPYYLQDILEYEEIINAENQVFLELLPHFNQASKNNNILQLDESGVKVWEDMLGIRVDILTEDLQFRRERILNRLLTQPPYTERFLRARLDEILGKGRYELSVNNNDFTITLDSSVESQMWVEELHATIHSIKPVNMVYINRPNVFTGVKINEELSYSQSTYNYRLGIWRLDDVTPFRSERDMGVLVMATTPSVTAEGLKVFPVCLANAMSKMRINGTHLVDITVKDAIDNKLYVEAVILDTVTSMINKVEILSEDGEVLVETPSIVLPVVDRVTLKSTITAIEGV